MPSFGEPVLVTYFVVLSILAVYGAHRYQLLFLFWRTARRRPTAEFVGPDLPSVTVQLPLYNEATVVERLLDAVGALDWPKDRLEIQVLDDSDDETRQLAAAKVAELRARGLNVVYLPRSERTGYKAGALAAGLDSSSGEYLAVFDADFLPRPGFLRATVPHFGDPRVGMVQVRWDHLNREHTLLTRLQAMLLDGHFVVEHTARNRSGRFFNFNGTAGVWRRTAILEAGGWQSDTLTEDLDLSYRAQLAGWRFVYLLEETAPAELPVEMNAFKSQQHRWAKGSIQTALKMLPRIWRAPLPLRIKSEATFHLTANCAYPLLLLLCLLLLPAVPIRVALEEGPLAKAFDASIFVLATLSVASFYLVAHRVVERRWWRALRDLPLLMALGVGLAVNNSRAVFEALRSEQGSFVRTPKYNVSADPHSRASQRYRAVFPRGTWWEFFFALYLTAVTCLAVHHHLWWMAFFSCLFAVGFYYVAISSVAASLRGRAGMWVGVQSSALH